MESRVCVSPKGPPDVSSRGLWSTAAQLVLGWCRGFELVQRRAAEGRSLAFPGFRPPGGGGLSGASPVIHPLSSAPRMLIPSLGSSRALRALVP